MSATVDLIREVFSLTENVKDLKSDVARLAGRVEDLRDRIIRLEVREDLIIEKTRSAAVMAVNQMNGELLKRIFAIEAQIDAAHSARTALPIGSDHLPNGDDEPEGTGA